MVAATLIAAGLVATEAVAKPDQNERREAMSLKKVTPVLLTDDVDACIAFWEAFGLEAVMTLPGADGADFAILANADVELMYQTFASANADMPAAVEGVSRAVIYLEVDSLDAVLQQTSRLTVVKPLHTTDYGAREIYVRDPAGHLIGFAEQAAAPAGE